ncbi:hypothetical protein WICPIJ_006501, partial [Wickerhamomyces pijperi]
VVVGLSSIVTIALAAKDSYAMHSIHHATLKTRAAAVARSSVMGAAVVGTGVAAGVALLL